MKKTEYKPDTLRIGEIAVIGPPELEKAAFIATVCEEIKKNDDIILGLLTINDQLLLHVYGLNVNHNIKNYAWDLVIQKMIGYIVLYDWHNPQSLEQAKELVDYLHSGWEVPCIIAADVGNGDYPITKQIFNRGIALAPRTQFTFYRIGDPASVRQVFTTLLDIIIDGI